MLIPIPLIIFGVISAIIGHALWAHADRERRRFEASFVAGTPKAIVRADGTYRRVNEAYAEMLGYTVEELEGGMTWMEITHPDDLEADFQRAESVRKGRRPAYNMRKRYIKKGCPPDDPESWVTVHLWVTAAHWFAQWFFDSFTVTAVDYSHEARLEQRVRATAQRIDAIQHGGRDRAG